MNFADHLKRLKHAIHPEGRIRLGRGDWESIVVNIKDVQALLADWERLDKIVRENEQRELAQHIQESRRILGETNEPDKWVKDE